jgi:hypothetical protein
MKWLKARLSEPTTMGGIAWILLAIGVWTFTFFPHWRLFMYAGAVFGVAQMIMSEKGSK